MAKRDEISSTEKLLALIRNKNRSELENAQISSAPSFISRLKLSLKNAVNFKRSISVGVDIGYDDMKLVKMRNLSQQKHELVDYARISFEPDMTPDNPDFSKFLKNNLSRFCGSSKNLQIWGNISSARVEIRYLRIPKVPSKQIPNAAFWSHKKVAPYNEKEAIFDFEILGDKVEDGAPKLEVVSLTAPRHEIQYFKNLFPKAVTLSKAYPSFPSPFRTFYEPAGSSLTSRMFQASISEGTGLASIYFRPATWCFPAVSKPV